MELKFPITWPDELVEEVTDEDGLILSVKINGIVQWYLTPDKKTQVIPTSTQYGIYMPEKRIPIGESYFNQ